MLALANYTIPIIDYYKNIHYIPLNITISGVNSTFNMALDMNTDVIASSDRMDTSPNMQP